MDSLKILMIGIFSLLAACVSATSQHKADENAAVQKEAAQEIQRVCALPESERESEIRKVKDQSGFVIVCSAK
jgi:ABC-type Fe3+-hydroxamate transport system substrate-binding protein